MKKVFLTLFLSLLLIFGFSQSPCQPSTVTYGNKTYNTVQIGTQCWLKENLNIGTMIIGSKNQTKNYVIEKYCYNNLESNCNIYGGLYQWDEMMNYIKTQGSQGICPSGWHIPTSTEYQQLVNYLGGINVSGGKLKETGLSHWKSPNGSATNLTNFTAVGSGLRWQNGLFYYLNTDFEFWLSSEPPYDPRNPLPPAYFGGSTYGGGWGLSGQFYKVQGLSVRCIKN